LYAVGFILVAILGHLAYFAPPGNGNPEGVGSRTWMRGHTGPWEWYLGDWKEGDQHGHGYAISWDGDTYEGEFRAGEKHGYGTYHHHDGRKDVGYFFEDTFQGDTKPNSTGEDLQHKEPKEGEKTQFRKLFMKHNFATTVAARFAPGLSLFSDAGDLMEQDKLRNTLLAMKIDAKAISKIQQSLVNAPSQVKPTNNHKNYKSVVSQRSVYTSYGCVSDNMGSKIPSRWTPSGNLTSSNLPTSYGTGLTSGVTGHEGGEDDLCMWMRYELLMNQVDAALGNYPHLRTKVFYYS